MWFLKKCRAAGGVDKKMEVEEGQEREQVKRRMKKKREREIRKRKSSRKKC